MSKKKFFNLHQFDFCKAFEQCMQYTFKTQHYEKKKEFELFKNLSIDAENKNLGIF